VDIQMRRLALVPQFGGIAIDGRPQHYTDARDTITSAAPDGVDAVLEVAGVSDLVPEGVALLRVGGTYGFVGMVHPQTPLELTGEQVVRKCLTIFGVHNYHLRHLEQAVAFLERTYRKYPYHTLVSPPFALADLADAVQTAEEHEWCRVSVRPATKARHLQQH
jgi:threonine dehydrogenase-like Zn-dependent dehydrogenase